MTVDEIFSKLQSHMIRGLMIHSQMSQYYDFLGLGGYSECHWHHHCCESKMLRELEHFYSNHYEKLISPMVIDSSSIIPSSWYKYAKIDVDGNTKRQYVKTGLQTWYDWELSTKKLYEESYRDLLELGEVASATMLIDLICDVDDELAEVAQYRLDKKATDYSIESIIGEQQSMLCAYK